MLELDSIIFAHNPIARSIKNAILTKSSHLAVLPPDSVSESVLFHSGPKPCSAYTDPEPLINIVGARYLFRQSIHNV